jgi:ATP-dependent helicase/nuclease subunit A
MSGSASVGQLEIPLACEPPEERPAQAIAEGRPTPELTDEQIAEGRPTPELTDEQIAEGRPTPELTDEQIAEEPHAHTLTDEQQQAVARRQGSLLLAAGAGSGKTSVLVERFVRAVLDDGLAPGRILAITFTERAAGELSERVRTRFALLGQREAARETEAAFIGTFHGFCARLLRTHPFLAGLDPEFAILDEGQSGRLRLDAFRGALGDFIAREGSAGVDLVAAFGADRLRATVLGVYAQLRSQGHAWPMLPTPAVPTSVLPTPSQPISALPTSMLPASASLTSELPTPASPAPAAADLQGARACLLLDTLLQGFSRRYSALKSRRGAVDFDDLELLASALLQEHAEVRAGWSERLELLMVDEFQDTNPRQLAILAALERDNLFTVGDELQSIYGFRHADVGLFRARRHELAARGAALALTRNFRSRPPLLTAINAIFAKRFGAAYTPLVAGRDEGLGGRGAAGGLAPPVTTRSAGSEASIELLLTDRRSWNGGGSRKGGEGEGLPDVSGELPPATRWRHAEARLLAQRVADIIAAGDAQPGDVAVLLRAVGDLPVYQRALEERGLPTLAAVGSFWGHQQVGDLLAYLRLLANPLDELAVYSTLASPLVGISSDGLAHLSRVMRKHGLPAHIPDDLRARLNPDDLERLVHFIDYFAAERPLARGRPLAELLLRVIDACAYESHLLSLPWGERRLANVQKLLRLARRFEKQEGRDLRGFLDHVEHQLDDDSGANAEPDAPVGEDGDIDAVRLLSIHAAKGLEFPVVCLADLGRAPRALTPSLLLDGSRLGLRLPQLDGSAAVPTLDYEALLQDRRLAEAAEEDRIIYVALTRARERLLLSGAVDFERWPRDIAGAAPIAWLVPALSPELPALAREAGLCAIHDLHVAGDDTKGGVALHDTERDLMQHGIEGALAQRGTKGGVALRCLLNTPATFATVLREDSLRAVSVPPARAAHTAPASPAIPPASHTRPHPSKIPAFGLSYSSLSELERCGYRYYLEHVLGLPEDHSAQIGRGGLEGRQRGLLVHHLLRSLTRAQPPSEDDVARLALELGLSLGARERAELTGLVRDALATDLALRLFATPACVRREHPFAFSLAPDLPLVTGVLDLLLRDPLGDYLVVDYKSDRLLDDDPDLEAVVLRDYGAQRLIYALAALHDGAPRVDVVHWFLSRPLEWVTASFTAEDRPALERQLYDRVLRARAAGYAVSPAPHRRLCLTCPGRATLCSWGSTETLRDSASPPAR